MNIALKLPHPQQHQRVFLDDLIQRYKSRLISAADFILSLTSIYRAPGQKLNVPSAKAFYEQFGIAKSTFYRALKRLESLPELGFRWEPNGGISMWREIENTATSPSVASEKKEPTYTKLQELPEALRNEFEEFVRREYQKTKGQRILSFHRFMKNQKDFQNWWAQFQQYKAAAPAPVPITAAEATATESEPNKRTFSPIPENLRGLLVKKPT
jgi:hypothetical protein